MPTGRRVICRVLDAVVVEVAILNVRRVVATAARCVISAIARSRSACARIVKAAGGARFVDFIDFIECVICLMNPFMNTMTPIVHTVCTIRITAESLQIW